MYKSNIRYYIFIVLLIIIILFFLHLINFGKLYHNDLLPTGNIDVFDVYVNNTCKGDDCVLVDINGNVIPAFSEGDTVVGNVYLSDSSGKYMYNQYLRIFSNPAYEFADKIAPGSSNTYQFIINNNTNTKLKYNIEIYEEKAYDINLMYRLKRNSEYIIGSENKWVTVAELTTQFKNIDILGFDEYSLEWIWPYDGGVDDLDTLIGKNMDDYYNLKIKLYFEQVFES